MTENSVDDMEVDVDEDPAGESPLFNPMVLKEVFQYLSKAEVMGTLRLVCSAWNAEVMRYYYRKTTKPVRTMDQLEAGVDIFRNKTVTPLVTRFMFYEEVNTSSPLFLEFLSAAGDQTEEIVAYFKDSPSAVPVLRRVLLDLPNLERIDIFWSFTKEGLLFEADEERPVFPNLRHIQFDITADCKFEALGRQVLECCPNLRKFACANYHGQIGPLTKWFFNTVVMDPTFPTLACLEEFNYARRLKFTEPELRAFTRRRFPLTQLFLDCSEDVSKEALDEFLLAVSGTLRKLFVSFSKENARELTECLKHLVKLEVLEVKEFEGPLALIYSNLPKLKALELRGFRPEGLFPLPPKPKGRPHGLERLTLAQPYSQIPESVLHYAKQLFPKAKCSTPKNLLIGIL